MVTNVLLFNNFSLYCTSISC